MVEQVFKPSTYRKWFIDKKIREKTYPTTASLARDYKNEFGKKIDPRTIAADIAEMREDLKAPIKYDAEKRGFFYANPDYTLDFIKDELAALPEIAESLGMAAIEPFASLSTPVVSILASMVLASAWRKNPLSNRVSIVAAPEQDEAGKTGRAIRDALTGCRELAIGYRNAAGLGQTGTVRPLHLVYHKNECLLLAGTISAAGEAGVGSALPYLLLPLSRIHTASVTGATFSPPRYVHTSIHRTFGPQTTGQKTCEPWTGEIDALLSMDQHDTLLVFTAAHPAGEDVPDYTLVSKTDMYEGG